MTPSVLFAQKREEFTDLPHHSQEHFRILQAGFYLLASHLCLLVLRGSLLCSVSLVSNLVSLYHLVTARKADRNIMPLVSCKLEYNCKCACSNSLLFFQG